MYLIVGIDPGTTTGVAALNFRGEIVDLFSSKNLSLDSVIKHLISLGRVSVVATDVVPTPNFVSKLAAQLGSRIYTPAEPIQVSEKIELTRHYKPEDKHQRDALAAALHTFNKFKNKFQKIDSLCLGDDVKDMVLRGYSISESVRIIKKRREERRRRRIKPKDTKTTKMEMRNKTENEKEIRELKRRNSILIEKIEERDREIERLKKEILRLRRQYNLNLSRDNEIKKRERSIRNLRYMIKELRRRVEELEKLGELWVEVAEGRIKPIGIFPSVYNGLTIINRKLKRKDNKNLENVEMAFVNNPREYKFLRDFGIMVFDKKYIREISGVFYIRTKDLERIKKEKKKISEISLERLIEDYRRSRFL
ncbi:MAG: hypothetical protein DRO94_04570 [Candidatus Altiarchaeales archaeon]|nr:MAG: hypothetical protein DRO95_03425 [Candidatus Altiarchaeales archaeon]RLI93706.1 MAG: hypothetical protein DRO94_04570 [Candidatus Altiarchaeales archaeon]HDO82288.1 DUF460 domain-containing protein [Candidatus Altiarchaeales archaeon]HEX54937.1 DUF460 domain-containing protein [Candidatus Altiarchaeales archaeon]